LPDWAVNIANEMGISNFQASGTWITRFKQVLASIGSREITKFVSRSYVTDKAMIEQSIKHFLASTKSTIASYEMSAVYNADQSGFVREMRGKRTLSHVGERHTLTAAQSVSALTPSYTIMPVISMDDSLLPRLYIYMPSGAERFIRSACLAVDVQTKKSYNWCITVRQNRQTTS
jgi:hypothetical protein